MIRKLALILLLFITCASVSWGAVDLYVTPSTASFERNSANGRYNVTVMVRSDTTTEIEALGDFFLTYDTNVFEVVAAGGVTDIAEGYIGWEANQLNLNYATNGSMRTIHYGKANSIGSNWQVQAGTAYPVVRLSMFVKNNAILGNTVISFVRENCHIIDGRTHTDVIAEITSATFNIVLDNTKPISTIYPSAGTYLNPQNVYISTSESNHEALVHFTTQNWAVRHIEADTTKPFNVPGQLNQVLSTTVFYYAEDLALDKAHNIEATRSATYIIDMQAPTFTIIDYTTGVLGAGDLFQIRFTSSEPLRPYPTVTVGGKTMQGVGSGSGPYVFTRTLNGSENQTGAVVINGRDFAQPNGNLGTNTAVTAHLDFGGPQFAIHTAPTPAVVEEELLITFSASEELGASPDVTVGLAAAEFIAFNPAIPEYNYRVTVSGYGWLLVLGADKEPPYTFNHYPPINQTNVAPETNITFVIADTGSGVASSSIQVMIQGEIVISNGVFVGDDYGYAGSIQSDGLGGYVITIEPEDGFKPNREIQVAVYAADLSPSANALDPLVYSFWTTSGGELRLLQRPLAIPSVYNPREGEAEIVYKLSQASDIEVRLYDISGALVWQEVFEEGSEGGKEGLNRVSWDGKNGFEVVVSNGVYMIYIVEHSGSKKANVLGDGKIVILKD